MNILTNAEITRLTTAYDQLTEVADNNDDRSRWAFAKTITLVALGTALRGGELLALQWRDIELLERRLHAREALVGGEITTLKSRASRRTITLGPRTTAVLADWWQQTPYKGNDELAFPNPHTGNAADPSMLSKYMRQAL
ncbi:MAG: hypothetical protein OXG37_08845 [Actinomycetia bacterium]|nr:hypothetical protein [Actinomycetes bacterium]